MTAGNDGMGHQDVKAIVNRPVEPLIQRAIEGINLHLFNVMAETRVRELPPWAYCFPCAYVSSAVLERLGINARVTLCSLTVDCDARHEGWIDGLSFDAYESDLPGSDAGHVIVTIDTVNGALYFDPSAKQFWRNRRGMDQLTVPMVFTEPQFSYLSADQQYQYRFDYIWAPKEIRQGNWTSALAYNDGYRAEIETLVARLGQRQPGLDQVGAA